MNKTHKILFFISTITAYFVMFLTFMTAYFNSTKSILVTINTVGEANLEFMLFVLSFPVVLVGSKDYLDYIIDKNVHT